MTRFSVRSLRGRFSLKRLLFAWYRHYKAFFLIGFCVVLGFGGWSWYYSLYQYRWSDEEKKNFLDTYAKETNFKEVRFRETVDRLNGLAKIHDEDLLIKRDVFTGESIVKSR